MDKSKRIPGACNMSSPHTVKFPSTNDQLMVCFYFDLPNDIHSIAAAICTLCSLSIYLSEFVDRSVGGRGVASLIEHPSTIQFILKSPLLISLQPTQ